MSQQKEHSEAKTYRFGQFEANTQSGELRRTGIRVRLQEQPFQILLALLERPGDVISREELRRRLWAEDTFVDFENGLNSAVNRLREALGDAADNARFVETLPRRGYRFIAPVQSLQQAPPENISAAPQQDYDEKTSSPHSARSWWVAAVLAVAFLAVGGFALWRKASASTASAGKVLLAILPFEDLTGNKETPYFSSGLAEELILRLGRLRQERLGVIARTSVMAYTNTRKPIAQIGQELGVNYVLTGTIRRANATVDGARKRYLITAQLVNVADQVGLWSESFEHSEADFLEIQTDVAVRVTSSLASELLPELQTGLQQTHRVNPEAQAAYMKGRFYWNQRSGPSTETKQRVVEYFQEAIRLDPAFANAYSSLAAAQLTLATGGLKQTSEVIPPAREAAERALALDPNLAEAYLDLARIKMYYDRDWSEAEKLYQKTIALDPNFTDARFYYSVLLSGLMRFPEARQQIAQAEQIDPLSPSAWLFGSLVEERVGDTAAALKSIRRHSELFGDAALGHINTALVLGWAGQCQEGLKELHEAEASDGWIPDYAGEKAAILYRCGDHAGAAKARLDAVTKGHLNNAYRTSVEASVGNAREACAYLEKAIQLREASLTIINADPRITPIRGEACFQNAMRKVGLPFN